MTVYFPWENEPIEKVKKKIMNVLPPMPQPPSPKETGEAWGKVITETPEYALPFAPKIDIKQLGKALVGSASAITSTPGLEFLQPLQIKSFHGSPYKFSKFKNKAIGTGEGAQAFGYGHYLTESPEVAKSYAKVRPTPELSFHGGKTYPNIYASEMNEIDFITSVAHQWSKGYAPNADDIFELKKGIIETAKNQKRPPEFIKKVENELKNATYEDFRYNYGENVYETTIHKGKQPSEYTYLEWDKPVGRDLLNKIDATIEKTYPYVEGNPPNPFKSRLKSTMNNIRNSGGTGQQLYNQLEMAWGEGIRENPKWASQFMQEAGISGIKYPTGSLSGMKGTGKYNYVVFNPEDITIESILPPGIEK